MEMKMIQEVAICESDGDGMLFLSCFDESADYRYGKASLA